METTGFALSSFWCGQCESEDVGMVRSSGLRQGSRHFGSRTQPLFVIWKNSSVGFNRTLCQIYSGRACFKTLISSKRYTNPTFISQKTHYVSTTETNRLIMFRETVAVYCENHTEHTNDCAGRMQSFTMLKQMVLIVTTLL
jgi:hypothetical protein